MPFAIILAGPNGAGKSTLQPHLTQSNSPFLNADLIARELREEHQGGESNGLDIAAGRLLLQRIDALITAGGSFVTETNLANRSLVDRITTWQSKGYTVVLHFVSVGDVEVCVHRVAQRVRAGGHDIPEETIRRRYRKGLQNFFTVYLPLVDEWFLHDNTETIGIIAKGEVADESRWHHLYSLAFSNS
jgi:predicted ABC-type ATPase